MDKSSFTFKGDNKPGNRGFYADATGSAGDDVL